MMTRKERMEYSSTIASGIYASMNENWFCEPEGVVRQAIRTTLLLEKGWAEIESQEEKLLENPCFDAPSPLKQEKVEEILNDLAF